MERIKKISVKTVHGKVTPPAQGEITKIMSVMGVADGLKTGTTTIGEYTALEGDFVAKNDRGQSYRASLCFLPDIALTPILQALKHSEAVEFVIDISVKGDSTSPVKYSYTFSSPLPPEKDDVIARLEARLKALPSAPEEKVEAKGVKSKKK